MGEEAAATDAVVVNDQDVVVDEPTTELEVDAPVVETAHVVTQMYEPRYVAPAVVYMAPSVPVADVVYMAPAAPAVVIPQEELPAPKSTFMWNGTEYDSYDAAVEAMRAQLAPSADVQESNVVEESNVVDAYADANVDVNVEATKPAQIRAVRSKKKGCC